MNALGQRADRRQVVHGQLSGSEREPLFDGEREIHRPQRIDDPAGKQLIFHRLAQLTRQQRADLLRNLSFAHGCLAFRRAIIAWLPPNDNNGVPPRLPGVARTHMSPSAGDLYGLPLSTCSKEAEREFVEGQQRQLAGAGGAEARYQAALLADPAFALAHAALAQALQELGRLAEAAAARDRAAALVQESSRRERQHVELGRLLADGRSVEALALGERHLSEFPRDALILEQLSTFVFFHGGKDKRSRALRLFEEAAPHYAAEDWFVLGRLAFHAQELHQYERARDLGRRALSANPANANAAHALAHVLHLTDEPVAAAEFLRAWLESATQPGRLHAHLWWHHALADLERADPAAARETFERRVEVAPGGSKQLALADAVGFLWRLRLYEGPVPAAAWEPAAKLARELARKPGRPFVDVHAAMALASAGDDAELEALGNALELLRARGSAPAAYALPLVRGVAAFSRGAFGDAAAQLLVGASDEFEPLGGSNVERALLGETLLEALLRAGDAPRAAELAERLVHLRRRPRALAWRARALKAQGHTAEARALAAEAELRWGSARRGEAVLPGVRDILTNG